jgi:AhpD family alkylhydroperoxidase
MQARMSNPAMVVPGVLQALAVLGASAKQGGVPSRTIDLIRLRTSQINGCGVCVEMHAGDLKKAGETDERLFAVAAWREASCFTDAERAALRPPPGSATRRTRCLMRSGTRLPGTTTNRRLQP